VSKKKDQLTRLLEQVPTPQEYQVVWENVRKDGSRGSVVLAGTLVEDSLRALLISEQTIGLTKDQVGRGDWPLSLILRTE
jgi:hypothetical protein